MIYYDKYPIKGPPPPAPTAPYSTAGATHSALVCTVGCSLQHCSGSGATLSRRRGNIIFEVNILQKYLVPSSSGDIDSYMLGR